MTGNATETPDTRAKLRVLDLFSGIGGFSLGLERTGGFETVAFCEIDPFCRKVLAKHWPEVPCYDDITTARFDGPVDVVTAGFPCQDISLAGAGAGLSGERSGLFWHILRAVRLVGRPRVVLENVAALLERGLGTVLGALASLGYDTQWHCIPASAVGAPQERDRVWIVADPCKNRATGLLESEDIGAARQGWTGGKADLLDIASASFERGDSHPQPLLRGMDERPSDWVDRIGALGNAVVPQIPELIGNAILAAETPDTRRWTSGASAGASPSRQSEPGGGVPSRLRADLQPFILPEGNVAIAFSGGRTSGMMLHHILEANGGLPERVVVSFQNTGREMPETLDFVQECGERWGVHIVWLEYRSVEPRFEIVSHNSASRDGEPFEALIRKKRGLPYKFARFCTSELKVHCQTRYLRSLGWDRWAVATGIRADEAHRANSKNAAKERWNAWFPLFDAGVSKRDVSRFWASQPFDLRLPNVNGRTQLGNCDGCFLKSEAARAALAREHPERFQWWADMEAMCSANGWGGRNQTFLDGQSYAAMGRFIERQGDWIFDTEGALCQADDGECVG